MLKVHVNRHGILAESRYAVLHELNDISSAFQASLCDTSFLPIYVFVCGNDDELATEIWAA